MRSPCPPGKLVILFGGDVAAVAESLEAAAGLALKACQVAVVRMHLALGIGGKGYFVLAGPLADVEAALQVVRAETAEERLVGIELIPQPHGEVRGFFE